MQTSCLKKKHLQERLATGNVRWYQPPVWWPTREYVNVVTWPTVVVYRWSLGHPDWVDIFPNVGIFQPALLKTNWRVCSKQNDAFHSTFRHFFCGFCRDTLDESFPNWRNTCDWRVCGANPQQKPFSAKHVEIALWPHHRICQDVHHPAAEGSTNNCSQPELLEESAIETCKGISFCHSALNIVLIYWYNYMYIFIC